MQTSYTNLKIPSGSEQKFYLTSKGLEKIKKEYTALKNLRNLKLKGGEVPQIMHSEDLNPEYLAFQDDLSLLESKMTDLEYILKNFELVKVPTKEQRNTVQLGARVAVEIDGQQDEFEIVGTLEANPALGRISNESPVGKALLGRKIGEEIILSSPIKTLYKIKKIKYQES